MSEAIKVDLRKLNKAILDQGRQRSWCAGKVGVSRPLMTYMLNGTRGINRDQLRKLALALGKPIESFVI